MNFEINDDMMQCITCNKFSLFAPQQGKNKFCKKKFNSKH